MKKNVKPFAEFFENSFSPNDATDQQTMSDVEESLRNIPATVELSIPFVNSSELNDYINILSTKKSPGPDLIPNIVLKNLTCKGLSVLSSIFNACLSLGHFPFSWKQANVIVIHKHGKPKNFPSSYRLISLLNTLSKLLEKLIQKRILNFLESVDIIPPHQFGFRANHSTVHQIHRLSEVIVKVFELRKSSSAIFIDIAQAFVFQGLLYKINT